MKKIELIVILCIILFQTNVFAGSIVVFGKRYIHQREVLGQK